jgi:hypothetical protein
MPETKTRFEEPGGFGAWAEHYYAWQAELLDELREIAAEDQAADTAEDEAD